MIDHQGIFEVGKGLMEQPAEVEKFSSGTMTVLQAVLADIHTWADTGYAMGYADRLEGTAQRRFSLEFVPELFQARYNHGYTQADKEEKQARKIQQQQKQVEIGTVTDEHKNNRFTMTIRGCSLKEGLAQVAETFPKDKVQEGIVPMAEDQNTESTKDPEETKESFMSTAWKYIALGVTAGFVGGMIGMGIGMKKGMSMKTSLSSEDDSPSSK